MLVFIDNFFGAIITTYALIYTASKLENYKINYKGILFYLTLICLTFISIFNYYQINVIFKLLFALIMMFIFFCILFKINKKSSLLLVIYTQMIIMVADGIGAVCLATVLNLNSYAIGNSMPKVLINLFISILIILLVKIPIIRKLYHQLKKVMNNIKIRSFIIFIIFLMFLTNIIATIIYSKLDFRLLIIFNITYTVFCFLLLNYLYKTKDNYVKVYDKYNTTLNSLKEYEYILDRYRISNHENKNELLTIRNMISKSDKKTISYIDKIVENKLKDNDRIMVEVSIIPSGGLRGLIYSKLLTMKNQKIDYQLQISNSIKTVDLISLDDILILDICKVVGVYLDNAIEEVTKLKKKYINICMYTDEKDLIIEITNNYKGNIDLEKLTNTGYTSKGKGHGYGLSLVNEIVLQNKKLISQNRISKNNFTQILKIKM